MEIKEKKIALLLVLKKLEDMASFEFWDTIYGGLENPARAPMILGSAFTLNNCNYEIREGVFLDVLGELERDHVVKMEGAFSSEDGTVYGVSDINLEKTSHKLTLLGIAGVSMNLLQSPANSIKVEVSKEVEFDITRGILHFRGKEVLISRSKNSRQYEIVRILFQDRRKDWSFDEIAEEIDPNGDIYDKRDWRKYYLACRQINEKIAIKTTIEDLIVVTAKTAMINPEYLN